MVGGFMLFLLLPTRSGPARRSGSGPPGRAGPPNRESVLLKRVLGIQCLDSRRACTPFLLLRRLSSEETMSTRPTHDLGCN